MQFQADILESVVIRPKIIETTALGAAYLAGLAVGYWPSIDDIKKQWQADRRFEPAGEPEKMDKAKAGWSNAIRKVLNPD